MEVGGSGSRDHTSLVPRPFEEEEESGLEARDYSLYHLYVRSSPWQLIKSASFSAVLSAYHVGNVVFEMANIVSTDLSPARCFLSAAIEYQHSTHRVILQVGN